MNEKVVVVGSAVTAFLASLCCLGPLLLGGIGLGIAVTASFESLRPYFLGLTALLVGVGFYLAYRKPKVAEGCAVGTCGPENSRVRRFAKPFLWMATVGVVALALFPLYGARLVSAVKHPSASLALRSQPQLAQVALKVSGMTCEMCAASIEVALEKLPGVAEAQIDFAGAAAHVRYDGAKVKPEQLIEAVHATGFRASL